MFKTLPTTMSLEKYKASMILSAVGDMLGYKNGDWEFCFSGEQIHKELKKLGGLRKVNCSGWIVSDDTVMHLAVAESLVSDWKNFEELFCGMAAKLKEACKDMARRAPGMTTTSACIKLKPNRSQGYIVPFNSKGGGCGAAMRAMCIGLRFPKPDQLDSLIAVSVECGRMTHNHPTGYLGSFTAALFTSYAVQEKPVREWGAGLLSALPQVKEYIHQVGRDVADNDKHWNYFTDQWTSYLTKHQLFTGTCEPVFPETYGILERDAFYKSISWSGWGGASGHDACIIAYDALLGAGSNWEEFCSRSMFHGGDSDTTGAIGGAWWGALYGLDNVPTNNYEHLEYRKRLETVSKEIYEKSLSN